MKIPELKFLWAREETKRWENIFKEKYYCMGVASEVPGVALSKGKKASQQRLSRTKSSNRAEYLRE